MIPFFSFLGTQRDGIVVILTLLTALCAILNWVLWMFGSGRFRGGPKPDSIRFVLGDFFVKIINDFRHLLALSLVILFGLALFAAMWPGMMKQDVSLIKDGLQGVAAALGGLIGSIIGYYFGESAGRNQAPDSDTATSPPAVEQGSPQEQSGITIPVKPTANAKEG